MTTTPQKTNRKIWMGAAIGGALLLLIASPLTAMAQTWNGPDGSNNISNANSGNVGIGLTVPLHKFDILSGTGTIARFDSSASAHTQVLFNASSGYDANLTLQNGGVAKWYLGNRAVNDRFSLINAGGSTEVFSILQNGKLLINATTPYGVFGERVEVNDSANFGGIALNNWSSTDNNSSFLNFQKSGSDTIGTHAVTASGEVLGRLLFQGSTGAAYDDFALIRGEVDATPSSGVAPGRLTFWTSTTTSVLERMRINSAGNVGIGTTNPLSNLQIGTLTQAATATPVTLSLGGTYSNTAGANLKLKLYDNAVTANTYGIGVSAGSMDFGASSTGGFNWYSGSNHRMILTYTGLLGVGTTTPGFKFDVQGGQVNASGGLCINGDCKTAWSQVGGSSQWTGSGPIYYTGGNVGIGTTSPGALLEVNKGQNGGTTLVLDNSYTTSGNAAYSGFWVKQGGANRFFLGSLNDGNTAHAGGPGAVQFWNFANAPMLFSTNSTERLRIDASGNVGIGTTSPGYPLHVKRDQNNDVPGITIENTSTGTVAAASFAVRNSTSTADALIMDAVGSGFTTTGGFIQDAGAISAEAGLTGGLSVMTRANAPIRFYTNGHTNERVRIDSSGNVGIGTTAPNYKLDVQSGQLNASGGLCIAGDCKTAWSQVGGGGGGGGTITEVTGGAGLTGSGTSGSVTLNIGAGTGLTATADSVSVNYGSGAGTAVEGNKALTITTDGSSGLSGGASITLGTGGTLNLTNTSKGSDQHIFKNIANADGTTQFSAGSNNATLRFAGGGGTTVTFDGPNKKVTIDGSTSSIAAANVTAGQFGAGNYTFPGNVTVNGNIAAKYQDVAEWVPSSEQIVSGTVVVLDSTKSNHVIQSTQAYDTRVAGVISEQPGITLGESGAGKVLVATTGRVLVKVDATRGPIRIGDLLVTSDVSGMAMKSEPIPVGGRLMHMPGTIIGKALEPLEKGKGEILVLLSLQ